ncbi:hypothetical protein GCM10009727_08260 [Actinomadura napierensis]|uniref:Uncharacterized protein n=1 Tax=Actinomadura napierensis TaxID=267854 RepID=A0ABN2Y705_9ACTN
MDPPGSSVCGGFATPDASPQAASVPAHASATIKLVRVCEPAMRLGRAAAPPGSPRYKSGGGRLWESATDRAPLRTLVCRA